jgi:formylglycine-generating enzyme required for sulfatase activity
MRRIWTIGPAAAFLGVAAIAFGGPVSQAGRVAAPILVELPPGRFAYRASGAVTRAGRPAEAPLVTVAIRRPLAVMKYQVTVAEYRRCADSGACPPVAQDGLDRPVVKVSWHDAQAYAAWLSRATGQHFRLPTDPEWAYAAAGRFADDALPPGLEDPGSRALARYERERGGASVGPADPQPTGSFGENEHGIADLSGNVWEWTDTCFERQGLDAPVEPTTDCFVRVVEGRHRTYLSDFLRTARGGGCSAGLPVANLGFRLVRDDASWSPLHAVAAWARHLAGLDA